MANYTRKEEVTTIVRFSVSGSPGFGIVWTDVMKAIRAIHEELWQAGRVPKGKDAPDDVIRLLPGDEEIIVFYEKLETSVDASVPVESSHARAEAVG